MMTHKIQLALAVAAVSGTVLADRTISKSYALTQDEDWAGDGVVTLSPGVTVDMMGHALTFGKITGLAPNETDVDLTEPGGRVIGTALGGGNFHSGGPAKNAFDNNTSGSSRVLVQNFSGCTFDYDFGAGNEKLVNAYRICIGVYDWKASKRSPSSWEFYGTQDDPASATAVWTPLDAKTGMSWTMSDWTVGTWSGNFVFSNDTAYRAYRMKVTQTREDVLEGEKATDRCLEFRELEFLCTGDKASRIVNVANEAAGGNCGGFGPSGPVFYNCTATRAFDRDLTAATGRAVMKDFASGSEYSFWYKFPQAQRISTYSICFGVADDNMASYGWRSPGAWELYGTTDAGTPSAGSNWVLLDARSQTTYPAAGWCTYPIAADKVGQYVAYRLRITSVVDPSKGTWMEFREIALGDGLCATLTAKVPEGESSVNAGVTFSGAIRFVKEGAGAYTAGTTGQAYSGGNEIFGGTFRCGRKGSQDAYGLAGGTTVVHEGGTFDCNGYAEHGGRRFELAGGTLANGAAPIDANAAKWFDRVELTADSALAGGGFGLCGTADAAAELTLNGHTLTLDVAEDQAISFGNLVISGEGTVYGRTGGWLCLGDGAVQADDATLATEGTAIDCRATAAGQVWFKNYVAGYAGGRNLGVVGIAVGGTFKPLVPYWHTVGLLSEATLDLSAIAGVFPTTCHHTAGGCDTYGTLDFPQGGTTRIDLGARHLALGDQLLQWSAVPDTTFVLAGDEVGGQPPVLTVTGLYFGSDPESRTVTTACWTGKGRPDDVSDPANWACTNAAGRAVSGVLPSTGAVVRFGGDLGLSLTDAIVGGYGNILFGSVRLTADCDWSCLRNIGDHLEPNATIDLRGRRLAVNQGTALETGCTFADTSAAGGGELHVVVPAGATCENRAAELAGRLKLVKEGPGAFVAVRKDQTYSGGTEVLGGSVGLGTAAGGAGAGDRPFGGETAASVVTLTVAEGGSFALNGKNGWTGLDLVLAGGTLAGTAAQPRFHSFAVTADSSLSLEGGNLGSPDYPLVIDLGTNRLATAFAGGYYLYVAAVVGEGVLELSGDDGRGMLRAVGAASGHCEMRTVDLVQRRGLMMSVPVDVRNYTCRRQGTDGYACDLMPAEAIYAHAESANLNVYGAFTPETDYFLPPEMQDGSTIDLSARTGTWSAATLVKCGKAEVTFAPGARVNVKVGAWAAESLPQKVVSWSAAPVGGVRFAAPPELEAAGLRLRAAADGLWLEHRGLFFFVR